MERLPYELLSLILAQLSQEDLVNLPFWVTSRGLSEKEISARSSTIDVWLDEKSLNTLSRVARHPVFSPSIQRIRLHPDELASVGPRRFRHYTSGEACADPRCIACYPMPYYGAISGVVASAIYKSAAKELTPVLSRAWDKADQHPVKYPGDVDTRSSGCKDFIQEPDSATKRYLRYKTLYDAQESMKEQNRDYILLTKALRRFRSLPAVIIDFHYGSSSQARWPVLLRDAWVHHCEPLHNRQAGSRLFQVLMRALSRCNLPPSEFGIDNTATPRLPPRPAKTKYLPEIQRQLVKEHRYMWKRIPGFQPLPRIFPNLRKFVLRSLWGPSDDHFGDGNPPEYSHLWEWWQWWQYQGRHKINTTLGFILDQCEMLEDLEISFVDKSHSRGDLTEMPYLPLSSFLNPGDPLRRPPLRNLKISNFRIRERELVNFLLRYSKTMRTIHFENLLLTSGSRETIFWLVEDEMELNSAIFHGVYQTSRLYAIDEDYRLIEYRDTRKIRKLENTV